MAGIRTGPGRPAVVALGEGRPASELGPRSALAGLVIGLLMMALVMAILGGTGLYDITFLGPAPAWGAAGLAVQAGVFEELLVRGILLRLVWRAFGPWVSIGVHTAWNFAQGYLFGAAVSGVDTGASIARSTARPDAAAWLTGGGFGPEASLPAVVVCTAVGAAVLAWRLGRFREVA